MAVPQHEYGTLGLDDASVKPDNSSQRCERISKVDLFQQKNMERIHAIVSTKKARAEEEALKAQRTLNLQRKLARHVLGSSFDAIASRSWSLPTVSSSSQPLQQADGKQCCDSQSTPASDDDTAASCSRDAHRLPSLPEGRAMAQALHDSPGTGSDPDQATLRRSRRHRTSTFSETVDSGTDTRAYSPRLSRSSGGGLSRSISLPVTNVRDTDKDTPSGSTRHRDTSPSKRLRDRSSLPAMNSSNRDADTLPPGAALYYQARAAQETQAQLMAKAYGHGATYAAYLQWRRRQKIPDHVKVFCMGGNGNHSSGIRQGLLERGWHENADHNSPFFDLKWSINPADINQELLWPAQVVNHFGKSTCITTKVGLCRTVRELAWYEFANYLDFYPRAYDLGDELDRAAWMEDARHTAAEAIVKRAAADGAVRPVKLSANPQSPCMGPLVDIEALRLALRVCVARLAQLAFLRCEHQHAAEQQGEDNRAGPCHHSTTCPQVLALTPAEWQTILKHPCLSQPPPRTPPTRFDSEWLDRADTYITSLQTVKTARKRAKTAKQARKGTVRRRKELTQADVNESWDSNSDTPTPRTTVDPDKSDDERNAQADVESAGSDGEEGTGEHTTTDVAAEEEADVPSSPRASYQEPQPDVPDLPSIDVTSEQIVALDATACIELAQQVVRALGPWDVQAHINGMNNVWIVKPAGKSRGRGIRLFNDLDALMAYVKGEDALSLEWRWVAQKYVERPLVIQSRKFDIRQWVLVTGWSPLTVWFWDTCYLRFAADDYDVSDTDIYRHLSNNSIAKYYSQPKDDDITAQGNMWRVEEFKQWLLEEYGRDDLWETLIQPAMKHIVVCTTRCAQDMVHARKNSCQLYGYDFLIDDQLRVWLLEVNSSPTMEASTAITTELCAEVQDDILKVVVDLPASQSANKGVSNMVASGTGRWRCIVDTAAEAGTPKYTGLHLEVQGKSLSTTPAKKSPAVAATPLDSAAPSPPKPAATSPPRSLVPSCYTAYQTQLAACRQALSDGSKQDKVAASKLKDTSLLTQITTPASSTQQFQFTSLSQENGPGPLNKVLSISRALSAQGRRSVDTATAPGQSLPTACAIPVDSPNPGSRRNAHNPTATCSQPAADAQPHVSASDASASDNALPPGPSPAAVRISSPSLPAAAAALPAADVAVAPLPQDALQSPQLAASSVAAGINSTGAKATQPSPACTRPQTPVLATRASTPLPQPGTSAHALLTSLSHIPFYNVHPDVSLDAPPTTSRPFTRPTSSSAQRNSTSMLTLKSLEFTPPLPMATTTDTSTRPPSTPHESHPRNSPSSQPPTLHPLSLSKPQADPVAALVTASQGLHKATSSKGLSLISLGAATADETLSRSPPLKASVPPRCMTMVRPALMRALSLPKKASMPAMNGAGPSAPTHHSSTTLLGRASSGAAKSLTTTFAPQPGSWPVNGLVHASKDASGNSTSAGGANAGAGGLKLPASPFKASQHGNMLGPNALELLAMAQERTAAALHAQYSRSRAE